MLINHEFRIISLCNIELLLLYYGEGEWVLWNKLGSINGLFVLLIYKDSSMISCILRMYPRFRNSFALPLAIQASSRNFYCCYSFFSTTFYVGCNTFLDHFSEIENSILKALDKLSTKKFNYQPLTNDHLDN